MDAVRKKKKKKISREDAKRLREERQEEQEEESRKTMSSNRLRFLLPFLLVLMSACYGDASRNSEVVSAKSASTPGTGNVSRGVETFTVQLGPGSMEQLIPAVVATDNTAVALARIDGTIVELKADEGTQVSKDQIIARLSDDTLRVQLKQAEIEVERLTIEARQYEEMIKVNKAELEQDQALAESGLASSRQVNRSQYRVNVATKELERELLAVRVAQAKVDAAKLELQKSVVRAPLSGVVTRRYARLGAGVTKDEKLFEVAQLTPLEVRFQMPSSGSPLLRPGSVVTVTQADGDRVLASAKVRRIDPIADAASNTVTYVADLPHSGALVPGMAVNVKVPGTRGSVAYRIPRSAFPSSSDLRHGLATTVFVVEEGRCAIRSVWIDEVQGDQVEIGSGLKDGDRVILSPPAQLKAGEAVNLKS